MLVLRRLFTLVVLLLYVYLIIIIVLFILFNLILCIMIKKNFDFIVTVSSLVSDMSQFTDDVSDFIGCQFALESHFGDSSLAHANNNYCGMRNPLVRISSAKHAGDGNYHWAQYQDLLSCVIDYLLCLQYYRPISTNYDTIEHFGAFISKIYCPERDYIDKINLIYQQFKSFRHEQRN